MCAKVRLTRIDKNWLRDFGFPLPIPDSVGELAIRWEKAFPGQPLPGVIPEREGLTLQPLRWGLIPSWSKDMKIGRHCFNARAETIAEKPAFRAAFRRRRCVLVVDAWFEWATIDGAKVEHAFQVAGSPLVSLAGLWESWKSPEGEELRTCTIVTTAANDVARPIHDRMPAVLDREAREVWLDPDAPADALHGVLAPFDGELVVTRGAS